MLPQTIPFGAVQFRLAPAGGANALSAHGQKIDLPAGKFARLYLLAAADGDQKAVFRIGSKEIGLTVQDWSGYIGLWDNRVWKENKYAGLTPGCIKPSPVAWFASHRHTPSGRMRRMRIHICLLMRSTCRKTQNL
jgi:alpha-mannosidase